MKKLVADWAKNKRFDEFVELERNVKSYVEKNLPFITLDRGNYHTKNSILLEHYPYESIISSCVRFAIEMDNADIGGPTFSQSLPGQANPLILIVHPLVPATLY